MSKYKAVVTAAGAAKITAASAGGQQLSITHMAVGDGNGTLPTPTPTQTKLVNERSRARLNTLTVDKSIDNHIIAEIIIPADVGGFWMREMGLYDESGTLIAVSNMAESYKPKLEEGSGRTQTLRMVLIVSSTEAIQLIVGGDTVLATRDFVEDAIKDHEKTRNHPDASTTAKGLVQLSSETTSANETKAATPKAVKTVNDASVKKSDNLSDLSDKTAARENLELGTAATKDVGTDVAGKVLTVGNYGLSNTLKALTDVDLNTIQTFGFYIIQNPVNGPAGSSGGALFLNVATWQSGAGAAGYRVAQEVIGYGQSGSTGNRVWRRTWAGSVWSVWIEFYSEAHKPTAQDTNALPITGGTLTGQLDINNADFINKNGYTTYTDGDSNKHRQAGGLRLTIADTILAELYYNETVGNSAEVSLHNKYGSTDSYFSLRNDGQFSVIGVSPQIILSNGTIFATDGNVKGRVWDDGYLSNWILSKANAAKDAAIDWANTYCARKPTSWLQPTGWFRDATTGLITQWGIVTRGGGTTRVWFPNAFPSTCVNVQLTLRNSSSGGSSFNIFANGEDRQGFNYISSDNEVQSFWMAIGY
jgi:hypothetical protein